jgi:hypothetical protein
MCGKSEMIKHDQRKPVNLGNIFDRHVKHEFVDHDVDSTMKTMEKEPIVHHVPTMTGGIGFDEVYNLYKTEFVGKMPNDTKLKRISRIIFTDILSCLFVTYIISNSVLALEYNASTNASEITGFSQNNSIRNLTNPVLKMERNPLANLSNPLANLSNPLDNLSNPLSNLSNPLANLSNRLPNLPNPLDNLTTSQQSADLRAPLSR